MNLHLLDIGGHIWTGSVNKRAVIEGPVINDSTGYRTPIIQSGGLSFIFNKVYDYAYKDKMIFVGDRYASIKAGMRPTYKSNRNENRGIEIQKELCEIILKDCGFEVLAEEGYEADDILYTICENYKKEFDKIYVHTGDGDMYFLVDDNVDIVPVSSRDKYICKENYRNTVDKKTITPYNSSTFNKVLFGCNSDKVEPLSREWQDKLLDAFYNDFYFPLMGNKQFMREVIKAMFPDVLGQFDLIYPLDVKDLEVDFYKEADLNKVAAWGNIVGNRKFSRMDNIPESIYSMINSWFSNSSYSE